MVKKKKKWNENAAIRGALRRIFARSPMVIEVKQAARKEFTQNKKDGTVAKKPAVRFKCSKCNRWFKGSDVAVDHIDPVVLDGFKDWNTFVNRLFCDKNNLQLLCNYKLKDADKHGGDVSCHLKKTREERPKKLKNKNKV